MTSCATWGASAAEALGSGGPAGSCSKKVCKLVCRGKAEIG